MISPTVGDQLIQERTIDAEHFAVTDGAAQQTANNIAASFIGRQHAVAYGESNRTDMVGNNFKRDIVLFVRYDISRLRCSHVCSMIGMEQIRIEVRIHILQNRSKPLQTCARIDIFIRKRRIAAVLIMIELREYEVPYFQETLVFSAWPAFRIGSNRHICRRGHRKFPYKVRKGLRRYPRSYLPA